MGISSFRSPSRLPFQSPADMATNVLLSRGEPDFPDLAEPHMLLGVPEIVIVLHGQPTRRRTERERSPLERFVRQLFAGLPFQPPATAPRSCPPTSQPHNPIRQNTHH